MVITTTTLAESETILEMAWKQCDLSVFLADVTEEAEQTWQFISDCSSFK